MAFKKYIRLAVMSATAVLSTAVVFGQAVKMQTWSQDIAYLQKLSPADAVAQEGALQQIRNDVEFWLQAHPESGVKLAAAPAGKLTADQAQAEIKELARVIGAIVEKDPAHPFHLGVASVNVNANAGAGSSYAISQLTGSIDQAEMISKNLNNVAAALDNVPGVTLLHSYGGRNQVMASVHGFTALQVPLLLDGLQINDPYDGTMDYRQFLTSDIAEIQVAKGFSSPLMGPNAVGGAINIVTKAPQKFFEGDALMGGYSGSGMLSSLRLGGRKGKFFAQGSLDWNQADYVPLSGKFALNNLQTDYKMNHTGSQDAKYTGRIGWKPRGDDEYIFSYYNQKANSGIPLHTGNSPLDGTGCGAAATASSCYSSSSYRAWNYWNKTMYYFHSNTAIDGKSSIKFRAYYDQYPNRMDFFTAQPYSASTLNKSVGYVTMYDDHAHGGSAEYNTRAIKRNLLSASFFFKDETHKQVPLYAYSMGPAYGMDRQQVTSIGLQDLITVKPNFTITVGMSIDHQNGLRASNDGATYTYNSTTKVYTPVSSGGTSSYWAFADPFCTSNTNLTNYTACTPHRWSYNPQISGSYTFQDSSKFFLGFARKSRFAGMKEMFSAKMGSSIPNPNLETENSNNWQIGYSRVIGVKTVAHVELFRSDLYNAIQSIPVPSALLTSAAATSSCTNTSGVIVCTVNENATHEAHQGVEASVHTTAIKLLTLVASYSYVNKSIDGYTFKGQNLSGANYPCGGGYLVTGTGSNVTYTTTPNNTCLTATDLPKNKATMTGNLRLPYSAEVNSTVRYEGGAAAALSYKPSKVNGVTNSSYYYELFRVGNFATWDLGVNLPVPMGNDNRNMRIQAGIKNLLDRNYSYTIGYPEVGRNWFVNARYSF